MSVQWPTTAPTGPSRKKKKEKKKKKKQRKKKKSRAPTCRPPYGLRSMCLLFLGCSSWPADSTVDGGPRDSAPLVRHPGLMLWPAGCPALSPGPRFGRGLLAAPSCGPAGRARGQGARDAPTSARAPGLRLEVGAGKRMLWIISGTAAVTQDCSVRRPGGQAVPAPASVGENVFEDDSRVSGPARRAGRIWRGVSPSARATRTRRCSAVAATRRGRGAELELVAVAGPRQAQAPRSSSLRVTSSRASAAPVPAAAGTPSPGSRRPHSGGWLSKRALYSGSRPAAAVPGRPRRGVYPHAGVAR